MLRRVEELQHYAVHATDGDIGRVHDFYFDDHRWTTRHVVVTVGPWLSRHRVLIPAVALREAEPANKGLHVGLTKAQIAASPDIDTDKPVSRQHEIELHRHYGFPYYLTAPFPLKYPRRWEEGGDRHLRSAREVIGYFVREIDDSLGRVDDLLVDDLSWAIRYLVVDTTEWWPGKKVLVSPRWVEAVRWEGAEIHVGLTRRAILSAPEYDPSRPIGRDYEARLHEHYRRPGYWEPGQDD